eukprot:455297-Lingulodinium_polyedra.AAC.1
MGKNAIAETLPLMSARAPIAPYHVSMYIRQHVFITECEYSALRSWYGPRLCTRHGCLRICFSRCRAKTQGP